MCVLSKHACPPLPGQAPAAELSGLLPRRDSLHHQHHQQKHLKGLVLVTISPIAKRNAAMGVHAQLMHGVCTTCMWHVVVPPWPFCVYKTPLAPPPPTRGWQLDEEMCTNAICWLTEENYQ